MTYLAKSPLLLLLLLLAAAGSAGLAGAAWPPAADNLVLAAPIRKWDEAIALGNGWSGCLLWGEGNEIRLSLDRGDLWDERTNGPKEWWKTQTWKTGGAMWEGAYQGATPTKLPAGGVFITLPATTKVREFELDKAAAMGLARFGDGAEMQVFSSATEPVMMVRLRNAVPTAVEVLDSIAVGARLRGGSAGPDSHSVNALGYPKAHNGEDKSAAGEVRWYRQEAAAGLAYGVVCETRQLGADTLMAIAIGATMDGGDWLAAAKDRCRAALDRGFDALEKPHAAWWAEFWAQSQIELPEAAVRQYYSLCRYYYGAASRAEAPPIPLQGVWSAATGSLPPWKGDYHSDLNTQMTYLAYQAAGNFNQGASYLNFLWNKRDVWRAFARDFYQAPGLSVPGVMSLAGQPLGGWGAYSLSPTMTSWNAHLFYLHWLYTGDDGFLKERAYPWCREAAECVLALLQPDAAGILKLPRSSSPEMFGNNYWPANTNYDLMSMRMHFLAVAEMAAAQGLAQDAGKWQDAARRLGDYHVAADGELLITKDTPLRESHRHLATVMGIHPFNLLTVDGSEEDRKRIRVSLARPEHDAPRHFEWCGYSWAWMACLRARVGEAEAALHHLEVFLQAYVTRSGFHVNQDQSPTCQFGAGGGRPFTMEGNFLAMQAVHEMLLQSWSATPGIPHSGVIRIFPAMPWAWHAAAFTDLRAEGGHRVSAKRENNATTWLRVVAGRDGVLRIRDTFGGQPPQWNHPGIRKTGGNFEVTLQKNAVLEATLPKPAALPPAPANVAQPVKILPFSGVTATTLPLRIGADSQGGSRFTGVLARVRVEGRAFSPAEIASLADPKLLEAAVPEIAVTAERTPTTLEALAKQAFRMDGSGFLEIPDHAVPPGTTGLTLAAWLRLTACAKAGMRLVDKSSAGSATGYLLDTYPDNSLRLIVREPHLIFPAKLPLAQWTHVAATVDATTGARTLYVNGCQVAGDQ